jgi:hemerythrin-like domain-containing protein
VTEPNGETSAQEKEHPVRRDPRVTRRTLITAGAVGAAAALGAGAAIGIDALTSSPQPTAAIPPSEDLMVDHGILKRILLAYREVSRRISAGEPVPVAPTAAAAALVQTYIESYHEALEEAYVFPRLQQGGRLTGLVRTLLIQHDRGRHLTAGIAELTADGVRTTVSRLALTARLDAFVRMYEPHEAWEDTVVFPAFREITPDRVFAELGERFADEAQQLFGAGVVNQMIEQVAAIEEALDIGDLNTFTPSPL